MIFVDDKGRIMRSDQLDLQQFLSGTYWDDILVLSGDIFPVHNIYIVGIVSVGVQRFQWMWKTKSEDHMVSDMFDDYQDMCIMRGRLPFIAQGDFNPSRSRPRRYYCFAIFFYRRVGGGLRWCPGKM